MSLTQKLGKRERYAKVSKQVFVSFILRKIHIKIFTRVSFHDNLRAFYNNPEYLKFLDACHLNLLLPKEGEIMKRFLYINLTLLFAFSLLFGCATTESITSSITSKVSSITSDVDQDLFAQVPEDQKEGIHKAGYDLKVNEEKLKLAELKYDLASNQKKYADYKQDLAEKDLKAASFSLDIVKLKAIDRSGLGKKEDNIKDIASLKTKKHKIEGERINIEAGVSITERQIKDLTEQIKEQEAKIEAMKSAEGEVPEAIATPATEEQEEKGKDVKSDEGKAQEKVTEPVANEQEPAEEKTD